jgi:ABC-type dipeptide/oligopeptide/nickel transport system ATPase component
MSGLTSTAMATPQPLLEVDRLTIAFPDEQGKRMIPVVRDVSFSVGRDEIVGLVGESGSGKTQTALAVLRLTRPPGKIMSGRVLVEGENIPSMTEEQLRRVRGVRAAMIFQSPRTSLNPLMKIGDQIGRIFVRRQEMTKPQAEAAALQMLERVGIAGRQRVAKSYPHQLSGGMAQRVMIAMMLACSPALLIADEPTTGLDVTIQAQIFELIQEIQAETRMSVLLITHDLGVVAEVCQRVVVMQLGRVVEVAPVDELFEHPHHPYTRRLLESIIRPDWPPEDALVQRGAGEQTRPIGGLPFEAVSVDTWPARKVAKPRMIEIAPGHLVLAHPISDAERQGAVA